MGARPTGIWPTTALARKPDVRALFKSMTLIVLVDSSLTNSHRSSGVTFAYARPAIGASFRYPRTTSAEPAASWTASMNATRSSLATINSFPSCVSAIPYGLPSSGTTRRRTGTPSSRRTTATPLSGPQAVEVFSDLPVQLGRQETRTHSTRLPRESAGMGFPATRGEPPGSQPAGRTQSQRWAPATDYRTLWPSRSTPT